jgi:hypothetical protein
VYNISVNIENLYIIYIICFKSSIFLFGMNMPTNKRLMWAVFWTAYIAILSCMYICMYVSIVAGKYGVSWDSVWEWRKNEEQLLYLAEKLSVD